MNLGGEVMMPWESFPACPCGCKATGMKLQVRFDQHLVGCLCRVCTGRRSNKKGHAAQGKAHKALGGTGFTPHNEESGRPYQIEVTVLPESKTGQQIPASFHKFLGTDWFRRALAQAIKAAPFGTGTLPAVVIDGQWLVVDLRRKRV